MCSSDLHAGVCGNGAGRLVEALGHLANGMPVARVADLLGYQSPSAFTAMFHRTLGVEPRRYFSIGDH